MLRLRILLGVVAVIGVASILGNIALGAVISNYSAMREDRDRSRADAQVAREVRDEALTARAAAESMQAEIQAARDVLMGKLQAAETEAAADRSTIAGLRRELANARAAPEILAVMDANSLLRRVGTYRVEAATSERASSSGVRSSIIAEEVRSALVRKGVPDSDDGRDLLFVRVSSAGERSDGSAVWLVQLSLMQRWRVPGTDASYNVPIYDESQIVETRGGEIAGRVMKGVEEVVERFCDELKKSRMP